VSASQLPDAHHNDDFPQRRHTDEDIIAGIGYQIPSLYSNLIVICQPPEKGMSIEENFHPSWPSMAASISAGSVLKSGPILILPRSAPG
jgi:hypothetical protein